MLPAHKTSPSRQPLTATPSCSMRSHNRSGSITTTGNGHARRLLVEAAWQHRKIYRHPGQVMRTRWEKASPAARARGRPANPRGACRQ